MTIPLPVRLPFLSMMLAASLAGFCTASLRGDDAKPVLRAGAATADITPEEGVSLDGPISKNGPVTGIHDPLHAAPGAG